VPRADLADSDEARLVLGQSGRLDQERIGPQRLRLVEVDAVLDPVGLAFLRIVLKLHGVILDINYTCARFGSMARTCLAAPCRDGGAVECPQLHPLRTARADLSVCLLTSVLVIAPAGLNSTGLTPTFGTLDFWRR